MDDEYLFHVWDENLGAQLAKAAQNGSIRKADIREHLEQKVQEYREEQLAMGAFLKRYITDRLEGAGN